LGIGLFDDDHLFAFDHLRFNPLLRSRRQGALALRRTTHPLHRIHHIALLCQEGVALDPVSMNVIRQSLDHIPKRGMAYARSDAELHEQRLFLNRGFLPSTGGAGISSG
jgi:hypothetical protein